MTTEQKRLRSKKTGIEVKEEGNTKKIYRAGEYVGYVEKVSNKEWSYRNRIGYGGKAPTERAAFAQLGFRLIENADKENGG
jgi:hypothetical protein